jgi:uncharacterized protein (UPF0147 family)
MSDLKQAINLLDLIINDKTVPKNIRKAAEDSKNVLTGENVDELKISTAITILDEIANDPNMPIYARTKIWNVVSILEQIRKKKE